MSNIGSETALINLSEFRNVLLLAKRRPDKYQRLVIIDIYQIKYSTIQNVATPLFNTFAIFAVIKPFKLIPDG